MFSHTRFTFMALSLALLVLAAGCGSDRITSTIAGPGTDIEASSQGTQALSQGAVRGVVHMAERALEATDGVLSTTTEGAVSCIASPHSAGSTTRLISAAEGGEIQFNRFHLTFPAGALSQDTYITISTPGNGYLMCELEPHGLQFNVPVTLEMSVGGIGITGNENASIFWLNTTTGLWENQNADYTPGSKLTVGLEHFSSYAGGRGGW